MKSWEMHCCTNQPSVDSYNDCDYKLWKDANTFITYLYNDTMGEWTHIMDDELNKITKPYPTNPLHGGYFMQDIQLNVAQHEPTLRDQFAMSALSGIVDINTTERTIEKECELAYIYADQMLTQRKENDATD